jgi:TRAP-type C4-dicarboxylate transport system permease small subunit
MDPLTLFGVFAVSAMMVLYALEERTRTLCSHLAGACMLASFYGFLQGAWPIWAVIAVQRWRRKAAHAARV